MNGFSSVTKVRSIQGARASGRSATGTTSPTIYSRNDTRIQGTRLWKWKYPAVLRLRKRKSQRILSHGGRKKRFGKYVYWWTCVSCDLSFRRVHLQASGYSILEYLKIFFAEITAGNRDCGKLMSSNSGITANKLKNQPNFNFILDVPPEKQGVCQNRTLTNKYQ